MREPAGDRVEAEATERQERQQAGGVLRLDRREPLAQPVLHRGAEHDTGGTEPDQTEEHAPADGSTALGCHEVSVRRVGSCRVARRMHELVSEAQRSEQEGDIREAGNPPSRSPTNDYEISWMRATRSPTWFASTPWI